MNDNFGYFKGDTCYRNGCKGIIEQYDSDYGCSCHTGHPPCNYCVDSREYCPECDWDGREEQRGYDGNYEYFIDIENYDIWN